VTTTATASPGARISSQIRGDWVVRAQDGEASTVLAEVEMALRTDLDPRSRTRALYAQALCLLMLGEERAAVSVARELTDLCRDLGLHALGLRSRSLLVDLLRRDGQLAAAVDELAHAVSLEHGLRDLADPEVQAALGALAVALRHAGVAEEARRIEARLAAVEPDLPRHQRVGRWSNLAFEHATEAMDAARRPPYRPDAALLAQAVAEIERAKSLAGWGTFHVVVIEADVLGALPDAVLGNAEAGLVALQECRRVLDRGPEAATAQLFWAAGMVRSLVRLGRYHEAVRIGTRVLAAIRGGAREGDRLILAYEVMRAEHPHVERAGTGTCEYLALAEQRSGTDLVLVDALFRARVDLQRGADERRVLARAASLDSLTGLVNRRGAASAIADAAARPAGEPVALLLIDLDGFKDVNDTRGHLAGDVVLQRVSVALRTAARLEDVVARWGGDEFVVVAVLDPDRAMALAGRLRATIRESAAEGDTVLVTGSIGVAVRDAPLDEETWLRRADEAMYAAKRAGGDTAVLG
jgi:diguanylate cyclase (GGDEF)-like protein